MRSNDVKRKNLNVFLTAICALMLFLTGCSSSDDYTHVEPSNRFESACNHYYYADLTCVECGEAFTTFDNVTGEFYGRLNDWGSITATVEVLSSDSSHLADGFTVTDTGMTESFDLSGVAISLDYRLCDGGISEAFDSIDDALAYRPQYPYDEKHAGKPLRESLGDDIIMYLMLDQGEVYLAEIIYWD